MKGIQVQIPNFLTSLICKLQYNDVQQTTDHEGTGKIYEKTTHQIEVLIECNNKSFACTTDSFE